MSRFNYQHLIHHTRVEHVFPDHQLYFDNQGFIRDRLREQTARGIASLMGDEKFVREWVESKPTGSFGLRECRMTLQTDYVLLSPDEFYGILNEVADRAEERAFAEYDRLMS